MRHPRLIALLLSTVLLLSLCCTGCKNALVATGTSVPASEEKPPMTKADETAPVTTETETAPTETVPETTEARDTLDVPVRMQNGGKLSFLPEEPLSIPKLSEMEYTRPDAEKLIADLEALTEKVPGCDDAETLLKEYYPIAVQISSFSAMYSLAYFHYCMDMSDSFFADEYDYCVEQSVIAEEQENALYAAFAASPCRDELEKAYFGEGFFLDYDDFNSGDETFFDLKQQENDLVSKYYELASAADYSHSWEIEQNHEASGNILIELIKVRQKIAEAKGYENYMDYSYACDFKRDYTATQAREFLDKVKTMLAPLTENVWSILGDYSDYSNWNGPKSIELLSISTEKMGGPIWDSFRFMSGYELYDISYGSNKLSAGYTDYIDNYEAPIILIDPDGRDLIYTLFHEFGHYCDYYFNYGALADYETAETYSQAMQYLAFAYADPFSDQERVQNLRAALADLLVYSVLQTGAYADFELQVYSLAPEELTVEKLDAIYGQCMEDYGLADLGSPRVENNYWSVYQHFFAYPGYVISYSDSAVASLQICRLEAEEPGAGVEAFCRLLNRTHGKKFAAVLAEVGLDSPFEADTLEKTAAFLKDAFGMN